MAEPAGGRNIEYRASKTGRADPSGLHNLVDVSILIDSKRLRPRAQALTPKF